jgi:hypothetical protein
MSLVLEKSLYMDMIESSTTSILSFVYPMTPFKQVLHVWL